MFLDKKYANLEYDLISVILAYLMLWSHQNKLQRDFVGILGLFLAMLWLQYQRLICNSIRSLHKEFIMRRNTL